MMDDIVTRLERIEARLERIEAEAERLEIACGQRTAQLEQWNDRRHSEIEAVRRDLRQGLDDVRYEVSQARDEARKAVRRW